MVKLEVGDKVVPLQGEYCHYEQGSSYNIPREPMVICEGGSENGYVKLIRPDNGEITPPLNPESFRRAGERYSSCAAAQVDVQREEYAHPAATSGAQREKLNALPYDLVPFQEIADAYSRVAEKGAVKYAPWNWSAGLSRVQLIGSLSRHTWAYLRGEECDKETGLNHTDHILWNAVALVHNVRWNLEDGRRGEPERNYKKAIDKAADSE